jgi:hypothetical protein
MEAIIFAAASSVLFMRKFSQETVNERPLELAGFNIEEKIY